MAREPIKELLEFMQPFDTKVRGVALKLREFVLDTFPDTNELIYDNYNALAIGYSLSDKQKEMFCHIAVYGKHVNIGFDHGVDIDDPKQLLKGTGNRIRHITVTDLETFQEDEVKKMLEQAHRMALDTMEKKPHQIIGLSIVRSVSPKKKRPN